jgi:hypothetical protein
VSVVVDLSSIEQSKSGAITGRIHFRFGEVCFPESDWSDFPVVVLGWWLREANATDPTFRLMDGPMAVHVEGRVSIAKLLDRDLVVGESPVEMMNLARSIRRAAQCVLVRCNELGLVSSDLDNLIVLLRSTTDSKE